MHFILVRKVVPVQFLLLDNFSLPHFSTTKGGRVHFGWNGVNIIENTKQRNGVEHHNPKIIPLYRMDNQNALRKKRCANLFKSIEQNVLCLHGKRFSKQREEQKDHFVT